MKLSKVMIWIWFCKWRRFAGIHTKIRTAKNRFGWIYRCIHAIHMLVQSWWCTRFHHFSPIRNAPFSSGLRLSLSLFIPKWTVLFELMFNLISFEELVIEIWTMRDAEEIAHRNCHEKSKVTAINLLPVSISHKCTRYLYQVTESTSKRRTDLRISTMVNVIRKCALFKWRIAVVDDGERWRKTARVRQSPRIHSYRGRCRHHHRHHTASHE